MADNVERYLAYVRDVKRYQERTCEIYAEVLRRFVEFSNTQIPDLQNIRSWEVHLMDDMKASPKTVSQHISVLSGYCSFLSAKGLIQGNPARLIKRPKVGKTLPSFVRDEAIAEYFHNHKGVLEFGEYDPALRYIIVSTLFATGLRRAELISLGVEDVDFSRGVIHVRHGKGAKMRDIPITETLAAELRLYLSRRPSADCSEPTASQPLFVTSKGTPLYPMLVERAVKSELDGIDSIQGRRSPHILRHTIATDLLRGGADLNSIKEMLGHSSLAATQVYTHNSIEHLKEVYFAAHPRSKKD